MRRRSNYELVVSGSGEHGMCQHRANTRVICKARRVPSELRVGARFRSNGTRKRFCASDRIGAPLVKGEFVLTNPVGLERLVLQWTPKPLPNTESDGDLEVTLH